MLSRIKFEVLGLYLRKSQQNELKNIYKQALINMVEGM